jgi:hypothetical protein
MPKIFGGDIDQLQGIDKSLLPYHKRLAMGLDTDHEPSTASQDFGTKVTKGSGSMEGNRSGTGSSHREYGAGDTMKGPGK